MATAADNNHEPHLEADEDYHVPLEYKIVDLPIIPVPQVETLCTFPCKIYRKVKVDEADPHATGYEWRRRCHGRVKFVRMEGMTIVAAFEYGAGHNRLWEQPVQDPNCYNLELSQEYENNWVYRNEQGVHISIALAPQQLVQFKEQWNNVKVDNTKVRQNNWLNSISEDVFV